MILCDLHKGVTSDAHISIFRERVDGLNIKAPSIFSKKWRMASMTGMIVNECKHSQPVTECQVILCWFGLCWFSRCFWMILIHGWLWFLGVWSDFVVKFTGLFWSHWRWWRALDKFYKEKKKLCKSITVLVCHRIVHENMLMTRKGALHCFLNQKMHLQSPI